MSSICLGILLLSAATLMFEIDLTRVFSVAQWYHFAFMVISLALLGFEALRPILLNLQGHVAVHEFQLQLIRRQVRDESPGKG